MVRRRTPKEEQLRCCVPANVVLRENLQEKELYGGRTSRNSEAARTRVYRRNQTGRP